MGIGSRWRKCRAVLAGLAALAAVSAGEGAGGDPLAGLLAAVQENFVGIRQNGGGGTAGLVPLRIKPGEMAEIMQTFLEVEALMRKSAARRSAYLARLKAQGIEEEPMSGGGAAFEIEAFGNRFAFDRYGYLSFDDRFVEADERRALDKASELYRRFHGRWMQDAERAASGKGGADAKGKKAASAKKTRKGPPALLDRMAEWKVRRVPVFRGFEDDRYQEHDALIVRCVDEFNRNRAAWAGCTAEQVKRIPAITTALVKSHMIEESGGRDPRSLAAWDADPLQVNVPGDWSDVKKDVGLKKPSKRNEGEIEDNIKAAIKFLARKGFGSSGRRADARKNGTFDGWRTALKRYNGRHEDKVDGRSYSDVYAEHIEERAKDPGKFVAIRKKVDKK